MDKPVPSTSVVVIMSTCTFSAVDGFHSPAMSPASRLSVDKRVLSHAHPPATCCSSVVDLSTLMIFRHMG